MNNGAAWLRVFLEVTGTPILGISCIARQLCGIAQQKIWFYVSERWFSRAVPPTQVQGTEDLSRGQGVISPGVST